MSLVRSCIRIAAVMALQGRTWAEATVYDSRNTPLDEAMRQENRPFITVFTDTDKKTVTGMDVNCADRELSVVFEIGIAGPVAKQEEGGPAVAIPATDRAFERAIDVLEWQVERALFHDPSNPWGELFRQLVTEVSEAEAARAGEAERGVRWAARYVSYQCDTIADPVSGKPLDDDHPVKRFIAMAKATTKPELIDAADLIEAQISGAAVPSWRQAQATLGLTEQGVRGIGIGPPYATPDTLTKVALVGFEPQGDRFTLVNVDERLNALDLPDDGAPVIVPEEENRV